MNNKSFKILTTLMNYTMALMMGFTVLVLVGLPWIVSWYLWFDVTFNIKQTEFLRNYVLTILYISGVCAFFVLNETRRIFKTCVLEDPFILQNVSSLKRITILSAIIALVFFTKLFVVMSFFTIIVVFVFVLAASVCFVLAHLFETAVHFKNENDLTI